MKANIHPIYHPRTSVHCACGEVFDTRSTQREIRVKICSKCHPFFTGKQKLVDSAGRVERFQKRFRDGQALADKKAAKPAKTASARA